MLIYIEVNTPGNGKVYDFKLDAHLNTAQVTEKIKQAIMNLEEQSITFATQSVLYSLTKGRILNKDLSLFENGIDSGQTLGLL